MPPILIIAAFGLAAYAGLRLAQKNKTKPNSKVRKKAANAQPSARNMGTLKQDLSSGVYHPSPSNKKT